MKEILDIVDFSDIWKCIIQEYDDHDNEESLISHFKVFEKLKNIAPISSDVKVKVHYHKDNGWCVDGINKESTWGIEFRPWNEWLGMEIEENTLEQYKLYEIIAHCLWEMTFVGFEETEIKDHWSEVTHSVDELQNKL